MAYPLEFFECIDESAVGRDAVIVTEVSLDGRRVDIRTAAVSDDPISDLARSRIGRIDPPETRTESRLEPTSSTSPLTLEDEIPETVAGTDVEDINTADGFKLLLADGSWLLVRPSGTEPVLRVYAEAADEERVGKLLGAGRELVEPLV